MKMFYLLNTTATPNLLPIYDAVSNSTSGESGSKLGWQELVLLVILGGMYFCMALLIIRAYLSMPSKEGSKENQKGVVRKKQEKQVRDTTRNNSKEPALDEKELIYGVIASIIIALLSSRWLFDISKVWLGG